MVCHREKSCKPLLNVDRGFDNVEPAKDVMDPILIVPRLPKSLHFGCRVHAGLRKHRFGLDCAIAKFIDTRKHVSRGSKRPAT